MSEDRGDVHLTPALSTKLEEEFVSPLTAIRGALEILRDFPDLTAAEHEGFVAAALEECERLEKGVEQLASSVYAAGQRTGRQGKSADLPDEDYRVYATRIHILDEYETMEVDFSDFVFSNSKIVNDFYNVLEQLIESSNRHWYLLVNYRNCSIWPEAWVAFAHRGKKANTNYSLATVHYIDGETASSGNEKPAAAGTNAANMFESRQQALAHIDAMRLRQC